MTSRVVNFFFLALSLLATWSVQADSGSQEMGALLGRRVREKIWSKGVQDWPNNEKADQGRGRKATDSTFPNDLGSI